jgi:lipoprotein-anchoring transpeptidase ErfK/SrfK
MQQRRLQRQHRVPPRRLWSNHQRLTLAFPGALVRQVVDYSSRQAPGTVIIDTRNTFLYFVLNDTQAMRYGIGVGREGFTWFGEQTGPKVAEAR